MKHSRNLSIGPGGIKCKCCFPRKGSKARTAMFRRAKRIDERESFKCEMGLDTESQVCKTSDGETQRGQYATNEGSFGICERRNQ